MKNKSHQHPFPRMGDKRFDGNKDGKLDSYETFFRDMHINEMEAKRKAREDDSTGYSSSSSSSGGASGNAGCLTSVMLFLLLLALFIR